MSARISISAAMAVAAVLAGCRTPPPRDPSLTLFTWERGIGVRAAGEVPMPMYLWFYEWNLFGAFEPGELSKGRYDFEVRVAADGRSAEIDGGDVRLRAMVDETGVALALTVRNASARDWPELAALIACFNPGPVGERNAEMGHHLKTYFLGPDGLERLPDRDMHFSSELRPELQALSPGLEFEFSPRWRSSARDAHEGLLLRESMHGGWTSGIAWERALGVQAHNPWLCMHVATKVGPLAAGATETVRGKIYLFPGDRAEGLRRFERDFAR